MYRLDDKSQSLLVVGGRYEERGWIVEVVISEVEENKKAVNGQGHTRPRLIATGGGNRGVRVSSKPVEPVLLLTFNNSARLQSLRKQQDSTYSAVSFDGKL